MFIFILFVLVILIPFYILYSNYRKNALKIILPYIPGVITAGGLAITMYKLSSAFRNTKSLDQQTIQNLIPEIADALLVSMFAIVAAIFVTLGIRIWFAYLENKRIENALEEVYEKPEKVLNSIAEKNVQFYEKFDFFYQDFKQYMQNQEETNRAVKDELSYTKQAVISQKNETKNLAESIREQTSAIEAHFTNLLHNVQQNVQTQISDIYKVSSRKIEENLEKISKEENEKFFAFIQTQYQETQKSMQEMMGNLRSIAENTEKLFSNTIEQQKELFKQNETQFLEQHNKITEKLLAQQENIQQNVHITLQKLESITQNTQTTLAQSVQTQNEIITQQQQNLQQSLSDLKNKHVQSIRAITTETHTKLEQLAHSIQTFDTQFKQQTQNILQKHLNDMEKFFEKIQEWNETNKVQIQAMQTEFKQIFENQQNLNHNEKELAQEIRTQIEAIKTMNEDIKILENQQCNFVLHVEQLQKRIAEVANTITTLDTLNEKLSKIYVQEAE